MRLRPLRTCAARGALSCLLAAAVIAAATGCSSAGDAVVIDLVSQFDVARRQPSPASFEVRDVTLGAETRRSVTARGQTRLTYHVTVPARSAFHVAIGTLDDRPPVASGGGLRVMIGVSDGRVYREKFAADLTPCAPAESGCWRHVAVDLREYEGLTIDVILNTRARSPEIPVDRDTAVWGAPSLTAAR